MSPLLLLTGPLYWSAFVFSSDLLRCFINKRTVAGLGAEKET